MYVCLFAYYMYAWCLRTSDPLELELQVVVTPSDPQYVGTENQIQAL